MEDRLLKLMDAEQLSSSRFADVIGVQRSSISHILSGRNKPSFDFLQKTLKAFPLLNADWLILGEGTMYETGGSQPSGNLFDQSADKITEKLDTAKVEDIPDQDLTHTEEDISSQEQPEDRKTASEPLNAPLENVLPVSSKKVARVIVFYSDKTFESFEAAD